MISLRSRDWIRFLFSLASVAVVAALMRFPVSGPLQLHTLVDPVEGFWKTARHADDLATGEVHLPGMQATARVVFDERAVPHIFANSDEDAIRAFGYVVSGERLFQMDFLRRVTSGRLAEVLGPGLVDTDRFLRGTGMARAVADNVRWMQEENRIDLQAATWFAEGVNARLSTLGEAELPVEFRLLGYAPEPWTPEDAFLVGWNLMFDLTYQRESALVMDEVRRSLSAEDFDLLFRVDEPFSKPIVPPEERHWGSAMATSATADRSGAAESFGTYPPGLPAAIPAAEGFIVGKGSNNWAVSGARSATGAPIVAGDMHLGLTLPAIWYEVHLVTPDMNTYGVTVPGVPIPIEAFNRQVGWTFTNTGADQIDHLSLDLNADGTQYRYDGGWRDLELTADTIRVLGQAPVVDTLRWSHWGPVTFSGEQAIATKWTGHSRIRTFEALWKMNHASSYTEFEEALHSWDVPMQNILVGAPGDTIAIRSTGYLPIRADETGFALRDGGSSASEWIGRVPFEELPHVINPGRGYLASTNQRPADETYPHYLGRDWRAVFRSIRIDALLSGKPMHTVDEVASYQSDVHAVQRDMLVPLIQNLEGLSPAATAFRDALSAWDGSTSIDRREPVLFSVWEGLLRQMVWDEAAFDRRSPGRARLYELLSDDPDSPWLDRVQTPETEDANDILRESLELAADSVSIDGAAWGEVHGLLLRHITGSAALRPLWRGPIPYPGYSETLSPGAGRNVTHSASWRVVLDFSGERIVARGIYPGGQSGNPFSSRYDSSVEDFASFRLYDLHTPETPNELERGRRLLIQP
ncbi:MAG: penicillin acylase family protein [Rhodothermales bacterium]|nr:penicillin acylase family protein [Rhodothermales bacterium]